MNLRVVLYLISSLILFEGVLIACSAGVAMIMKDPMSCIVRLLGCGIFTVVAGIVCNLLTRSGESIKTGSREGFGVVVFGWLLISIFGSFPFIVVSGMHWYDAFFETISGFTTTGATLIDPTLSLRDGYSLPDGIESLPYGILFWRSLTHWIGGMGIIVFSLAILPTLGNGGHALYNAEVPGVKIRSDQFAPRIEVTAKYLCIVYLFLTIIATFLLYFGGMTMFDAVCHAFSTIATGGFSTKNNSIAFYSNTYIQMVIAVFMFLGSCNFILHFRLLAGLPVKKYLNEEFYAYLLTLLLSILIIAAGLFFSRITDPLTQNAYHHSFGNAFRAAIFQVISFSSTTGFIIADYSVWPVSACVILLGLMLMGGCGGSTAGGMKCVRIILMIKFFLFELRKNIFPNMLPNIRFNGERVQAGILNRVLGYFMMFIFTIFVFCLILSLVCKVDLLTGLTASISCISNTGPAFGGVGGINTFSWMSPAAKLLLALEMLVGRLEIYSVLLIFLPSFWKK